MDYLKQPFWFKIRKVLRYLKLYGPSRTYMKVLGQMHMRRTYTALPPQKRNQKWYQTVGIIGCGNYSFSTIAFFLKKEFGYVIGACMDKDINRAASFASRYRVPHYTDNADDVVNNPDIRLIYIASNHATHAEYAILAMEHGKDVYIEKPHVVSLDQLRRLHAAMVKYDRKVFLGFNRPGSRLGMRTRNCCQNEQGAGVYNWFVAGHAIEPDHWYFSPGEGGRVLGNLCHWTDFIFRLIDPKLAFPVTITPSRYIKSDCDIAVTFIFAEGSLGAITFSSKGHTFEGVRESFRAQKGNLLISLEDFKRLTIEDIQKKKRFTNFFRDHGHRRNICRAYKNVHENEFYRRDDEAGHILNTAWLFLNTREALERNEIRVINSFEQEFPDIFAASARNGLAQGQLIEAVTK